MIELTTEKGEFVAVEYLDNVKQPIAYNYLKVNGNWGNYKLICKLSEATEEDAKGVVDGRFVFQSIFIKDMITCYTNYNNKNELFKSALESLHSLLTSKGIDINNGNRYLFKKV